MQYSMIQIEMDPWSASIAGGFNVDAGTPPCSPQGDKVQFDSELIKQECDTTFLVEKLKHECSGSFLLLAHNLRNMTEDGPQCVSLCICQTYCNNTFKRFLFFWNIEHFGVQINLCNYCTNNLRTVTQGHIKRNLYFISFI